MKYSSRFFLYAPLGVFLLLFAGAAVHWWILAAHLSARLNAMNGHAVAPGVTVSYASHRTTGFPFSLDTEFSAFAVAVMTPNGPTRWRSEKFAMHALTYGRDETVFEAAGRQRLEWTDQHRVNHTLNFAVGSLHASAIVRHDGLNRFDLDLVGFGSKVFTARRLQFHARQNAKTTQLYIAADGLTNCLRSRLRYAATVSLDEAFDRMQLAEQSWPDAIADWRAAGGTTHSDRKGPLSDLAADQILNPSALAGAVCR